MASEDSRIKVGQIGVGHSHAEGKMRVLRNSPEYEVVGVAEPSPEFRSKAEESETYRDLPWMSRDELLERPDVQVVFVETRTENLLDNAAAAVGAGKHIHLDKPPGTSLSQFRDILDAADQQQLTVQLGYMYRYNPAIVLLRRLLESGALGEVFEIHGVLSKVVGDEKRKRWAKFEGGTMFELGCHLIDLVVGILGPPTQVTAFNHHAANIDDDLVDNMLAVLEYPRAIASIKSTAVEVEGFDRRHFVVCGTKGTVHIQPMDRPFVRLALDAPHEHFEAGYQDVEVGIYERYEADVAELAQIVRGEKRAEYDSAHDLAVQETVLRAAGMPVD